MSTNNYAVLAELTQDDRVSVEYARRCRPAGFLLISTQFLHYSRALNEQDSLVVARSTATSDVQTATSVDVANDH